MAGRAMQIAVRSIALSVMIIAFINHADCGNKTISRPDSSGLDYQIATWYRFKSSAFSISFDDNYRSQVTYATPILNQHNYKATYFIVTNRVGKGWTPGWDTLNMLAMQGHEIASHSKNHANFDILSQDPSFADSMMHEFRDSRDSINSRIPYRNCETFAWPGGNINLYSCEMSKKYYMACRGSNNNFETPIPENLYNMSSQHIYHDTPLETVNAYIDTALAKRGWLIERWHGFRINHDTNGYEPVAIETFREHINHVAWNGDDLWVAPVGTVVKYMLERNTSSLSLSDSTGSTVFLNLTNDLPDSMIQYNLPVSIKVRLYGKMSGTNLITQRNDTLFYNISKENDIDYLYFNAVPNQGRICLHLNHSSDGINDKLALNKGTFNFPNPFSRSTTISLDIPEAETVDFRIYDQMGKQIRRFSTGCHSGINSIDFDGSGLTPGYYTCNINTGERNTTVRMVLSH